MSILKSAGKLKKNGSFQKELEAKIVKAAEEFRDKSRC